MAVTETATMMGRVQGRVHNHTPGTLVALDFGKGWRGAKGGMRRVMPYGTDRNRNYKGKKEGDSVPDMRMDFRAGKGDLVQHALMRAKVHSKEHPFALFAPSCTEESIAQRLEAPQGRGKGP